MEPGVPTTNVVVLGSTGSVGRSALSVIEHDGARRCRAFAAWGRDDSRWELGRAGAGVPAALHHPDRPRGGRVRRRPVARHGRRGPLGPGRAGHDGPGPGDRPGPERDRRRGRPAGDLGGARGRQDRRPGQQGDAGRRRPAGHGAGAAARGATILPVDSEHSAIFQALQAGKPQGGAPGDPDLLRRPVPGPLGPRRWPTSRPRRRCGTRPGGWGRRSRSTRPR